ncbi:flagellar hook-basal body protein [Paenibacillus xerothermodurans]|uniref:Flagellar hook-basal body protein n=1 Tax=Paenibacillus xerothermodurans TaxID=1977292 RepID=A0A2W1NUM6_PAEXE|nr:flagellar hook-basal body protein [Paenibacillus xerothermodurans]PZE19382.1 flagellar hook-basal body protein [Paenibacillus xerothermodurans]
MLRGLYTAASGMISQQRKHDIVTNNMANVNTPGFKAGNAISRSFPEMLIARIGNGRGESVSVPVGRLNTGVMAEENVAVRKQGDLQQTNNPFDFALISNLQVPGVLFDESGKSVGPDGETIVQPQAFFTVANGEGGQSYTLNGKFSATEGGQLITGDGYPVLGGDGQPIILRASGTGEPITDFRINSRGALLNLDGTPITDANNQPVSLLITRIEDPDRLVREGNGVYRLNPGEEGLAAEINAEDIVEVRQGFVERSNVDAAQSMVDMMTALKAYEANQKVVQFYDRSMEKAVNDVGRI